MICASFTLFATAQPQLQSRKVVRELKSTLESSGLPIRINHGEHIAVRGTEPTNVAQLNG